VLDSLRAGFSRLSKGGDSRGSRVPHSFALFANEWEESSSLAPVVSVTSMLSPFRAYFYGENGPVRVNFQEWALEAQPRPVQKFGKSTVCLPLIRKKCE
jgi:hypothetical protein